MQQQLCSAQMWLPFGTQAVIMMCGAVLISRAVGVSGRPGNDRSPSPLRGAVVEGVRWLWSHPRVRTLAVLIFSFNITFGAAFSVLVILASDRLGLDEIGYGLRALTDGPSARSEWSRSCGSA